MANFERYPSCPDCGVDLDEVCDDLEGHDLTKQLYFCQNCKAKLEVTTRTETEYLVEEISK